MTATRKLLTSAETAELLGILPNTLEIWRGKGKGPKFLKMGPRKQDAGGFQRALLHRDRYDEAEVMAWIQERTCSNTSQYMSLPQQAQHA